MMPTTAKKIVSADQFSGKGFAEPEFIRAYLQNAPFEIVDEMYASAEVDSITPLDELSVTRSLTSGRDMGKLLSVAKYSKIASFPNDDAAQLMVELAELSLAHKLAILSNVRINWYGTLLFDNDKIVRTKLLVPAATDNKGWGGLLAIISNPRMDRRLVSEIIRGEPPFDNIKLNERLWAANQALELREIPYPKHFSREDPDDNEMYFSDPSAAALEVVRKGISEKSPVTERNRSYFFEPFIRYYAKFYSLRVRDEAWLAEEVLRATDSAEKWESGSARKSAVLNSIANWASTGATNEPLEEDLSNEKYSSELGRGSFFAMILLRSLPRFLKDGSLSNIKELEQNLTSENWCIRAASYAALFEAQRLQAIDRKTAQNARDFIKKYDADFFALLRGLSLSRRFWQAEELSINSTDSSILRDLAHENWNDPRRSHMIAYCDGELRSLVYPEFKTGISDEPDERSEAPRNADLELLRTDLMRSKDAIETLSAKMDQTRTWLVGIAILLAITAVKLFT